METNDPIVEAFRQTAEMGLENDKAILEVVQKLVERMIELENKVDMLMGLHHVEH